MGHRIDARRQIGRIHGCGVPDHQAVEQESARVADQQITGAGSHQHVDRDIGLQHQAADLALDEHPDEQRPEQQVEEGEMLGQGWKMHHAGQPDHLEDDRAGAQPIEPAFVGAKV